MYWKRETFPCTGKQQLSTYCRVFSQKLRGVQRIRLFRCSDVAVWLCIQHVVTTLSSSLVTRPVCVYQHATCVMVRTTAETGPTNATAVSHIVLSTHMHMVQPMPLHPKPHNLLRRLNPDWFYLPVGTGLPRLSWKKRLLNGCSSGCGSGRGRGSGRNSSSSSSSKPSSLCTQLLCSCLNTKLSSCTFCILTKWLSVLNLFDFFELFCCNNRRNNFFSNWVVNLQNNLLSSRPTTDFTSFLEFDKSLNTGCLLLNCKLYVNCVCILCSVLCAL